MRQSSAILFAVPTVGICPEILDALVGEAATNSSSLRHDCSYETGSQKKQNAQSDIGNSLSNRPTQSWLRGNAHPACSLGLDSLTVPQCNFDSLITDQLSKSVGNLHQVRHVVTKYFNTIHLWMPVIWESRFLDKLSVVFFEPQADLSLLILSMAIITDIPVGVNVLSSASSLYTLVKSSLAVVEAANIHLLEVLQSRLLLSLFEVGNGIDPAAYITLGATARAAAAMGANLNPKWQYSTTQVPLQRSDEALCVWWGIVILDRYIFHSSRTRLNCSSLKPAVCDCVNDTVEHDNLPLQLLKYHILC